MFACVLKAGADFGNLVEFMHEIKMLHVNITSPVSSAPSDRPLIGYHVDVGCFPQSAACYASILCSDAA
jgi:hypothetical protein